MEHFFTPNGITEADKKRAVLLTVIGAATYKVLRNILSPAKPGEKTYAELIEALSKHYRQTLSEIVERYKFHSRVRKAGESIANYVAELSEYCNFGAVLNDMIRDRLVCGVNDAAIQKRLLAEPVSQYILSPVYFIRGIVYSIRKDSILLVWNIRGPDILSL